MLTFIIYLFSLLLAIKVLPIIFLVAYGIALFVIGIMYLVEERESACRVGLFLRKQMRWAILSIVICIFVPSQKTVAAMYLIPKMVDGVEQISENKSIQRMPSKVLQIFEGKLNQYIADLTPTKESE